MARKASELAEMAAVTLQVARDEVIATSEPEQSDPARAQA
jgi:hypothetical protein